MISAATLEARLDRIDALVAIISDCEAFLDGFFPLQESGVSALAPKPSLRDESDFARALAARIRHEREFRGWRQQDLAEITGIARPNIARLESGKRMPKISTLHKIAEAFGFRIEELMD